MKFSANAYELELTINMGVSPIFNVSYIYPYKGDVIEVLEDVHGQTRTWTHQLPTVQPLEIDRILDRRVAKRTKNREYLEYLVKWKGCPVKYSTWMNE